MNTRAIGEGRRAAALALALACALLAACAAPQRPPFRDAGLSLQAAQTRLLPGQTTRAEAMTALGPAAVLLPFDSGFEVWVYRSAPGDGAELVLLFSPSGVLAKTRLRPADAAS